MALSKYWIVDIEILRAEYTAVTVNHHEVTSTAIPANSRAYGPARIDLIFYLLEARLSRHAYKIIGAR
jgi:hypothetical protein